MATTAELYKKAKDCALHLPVEERSKLAGRLLKSLDEEVGVGAEWLLEIHNRADDIDSGRVELIEGKDFLRRLNAV